MDNKKVIGNPVATTMPFLELLRAKMDKEEGKGLSTNDFTNEDKEKLESIPRYISQLIDDTGGGQYIRFAYGADHALCDANLNTIHETYALKGEVGIINLGVIADLSELDKCNEAGVYVFKTHELDIGIDGTNSSNWETGVLIVRTQDKRFPWTNPDGTTELSPVFSEGQQCILQCDNDFGMGLRVLWREWNDNLPLEGRPWEDWTPLTENFVTRQELNTAIGDALEGEY